MCKDVPRNLNINVIERDIRPQHRQKLRTFFIVDSAGVIAVSDCVIGLHLLVRQ